MPQSTSALGSARFRVQAGAQPRRRNDSVWVSRAFATLRKALPGETIREKRMRSHMRRLQTQKSRPVHDAWGGLRFVRSADDCFSSNFSRAECYWPRKKLLKCHSEGEILWPKDLS